MRKREARTAIQQERAERPRAVRPAQPLPAPLGRQMESSFGHDFSRVRVHTGGAAADLALGLEASAFTLGHDIVFAPGAYAPDTSQGAHLIAHELAHVVQQSRSSDFLGGPPSPATLSVTDPGGAVEADAARAAAQVAAGETASVEVASGPVVARGLFDDWFGGSSDAAPAAPAAAAAAPAAESGGWLSGAYNALNDAGKVYNDYASPGAIYGGMKTASHVLDLGEKEVWKGIDSLENAAKPKGKSDTGIGALDWANDASAWVGGQSASLLGGAAKGAVGLVGGLGKMVVNPVDTVLGAEAFLEHNSPVPFLGSTLKAGHGLWDLAVNDGGQYGNSLGEVANSVFNPLKQQQDDAAFNTALAKGILAPGEKGWDNWSENPADAFGHAAFNVGSLFLGAGEASAAAKAGRAGEAATVAVDAARAREAAVARDAAAAREASAARAAGKPAAKPFDPAKPLDLDPFSDLKRKPQDTAPVRTVPPGSSPGIGGFFGDIWDGLAGLFKPKPKPKPPAGSVPDPNFYGPNGQGGVQRSPRGWHL
jgi:hypothetical protein